MTATTIRRLLNAVTLTMISVTVAAIASVAVPSFLGGWMNDVGDPDDMLVSGRASSITELPLATPSTAEDPIWARPLRDGFRVRPTRSTAKPVERPKPPTPAERRPRTSDSTGLTLVGTVLEKGQSVAIFSDRSGKLDFRGVGEELALEPSGIRVEEIRDREVTLAVNGRTQALRIGRALTSQQRPQTVTSQEDSSAGNPALVPNTDDEVFENPNSNVDAEPAMSIEDELDFLNGDLDDF